MARVGDLALFAGMAAIDMEGQVVGKGDLEQQMRAMYVEMGEALVDPDLLVELQIVAAG